MTDFFNYLKNPVLTDKREKFTLNIFLITMGMIYLLNLAASFPLVLFKQFHVLPDISIPEATTLKLFFVITIFAPLLEELIFRLNLHISKFNISTFAGVSAVTFFIKLLHPTEHHTIYSLYCLLIGLAFFGLTYLATGKFNFAMHKLESLWKSHFKSIFHLSVISFGLMHLSNFDTIYWWMVLIFPLLIAPQISCGYVFAYIRMRYGFIFGWLLHCTVNLFATLFSLHLAYVVVLFFVAALIFNSLLKRYKPVPE